MEASSFIVGITTETLGVVTGKDGGGGLKRFWPGFPLSHDSLPTVADRDGARQLLNFEKACGAGPSRNSPEPSVDQAGNREEDRRGDGSGSENGRRRGGMPMVDPVLGDFSRR